MKTYKIEIVITEGNDEFWEEIGDKSGCDEVIDSMNNAMDGIGFAKDVDYSIKLVEFKDA